MSDNMVQQWQQLKTHLNDALELTPEIVQNARRQSGNVAELLEEMFSQIRTDADAIQQGMANRAQEFQSRLSEASALAQSINERLQAAVAVKAETKEPYLPSDLAPTYAQQILSRYAAGSPAPTAVENDDSRVWFDASLVGQSIASANAETEEARSILANVSNRVAVWWTCVALSDALQSEWETMAAAERAAIERSVEWVLQPTAAVQSALAALKSASAPDAIAAAIGSLFDAIGSRDPQQLAGESVAGAAVQTVHRVCRRQPPTASSEILRRSRDLARDMKAGKRLWTEGAGDASASVADSLATFSRWTDG